MSEAVVLLGCGDVGPIHQPMAQYSELVRDAYREPTSHTGCPVGKPLIAAVRSPAAASTS
jgi:hypothetical protein